MTSICVYIKNNCEKAFEVIDKLSDKIPCFVNINRVSSIYSEVEIICRFEDAWTVERRLARFV